MGQKRLQVCLATSLLSAFLVGCSSDQPGSEAVPEESTSTEGQNDEESTPPSTPGSKGAVSFVKYYFATLDEAKVTLDATALKSLGSPTCRGCSSAIKIIDETKRVGGWFRGYNYDIYRTRVFRDESGGNRRFVHVKIKRPKYRLKYSEGGKVITKPAGRIEIMTTVDWRSGRWWMAEVAKG